MVFVWHVHKTGSMGKCWERFFGLIHFSMSNQLQLQYHVK